MNGYDLAYAVGAVVLSPWWARKARGGWAERLGKAAVLPVAGAGRPRLLLHAVSVGEVNALRELVPLLSRSVEVVVSASTDTGLKRAVELYGPAGTVGAQGVVVRYPLDFSRSVRRFLDAVKPDAVGLVELELWPNFVKRCAERGVPVAVINGRLSARSFGGYRKVRGVLRPTFGRLAWAAVQDEPYAERFVAMGVPPDRVKVTGSMKWDTAAGVKPEEVEAQARRLADEMGVDLGRPVVVAGSTSAGEERLLHEACAACGVADVQLICGPRKPERFDEAAAAMPGCVRRSQKVRGGGGGGRFLLDTLGELRAAYWLATVAVVGRTFGLSKAGRGGSDPIEPVALGRATILGEHYANFESITGVLSSAGAVRVVKPGAVAGVLGELLSAGGAGARAAMAAAGAGVIESHRGATAVHAGMLIDLAKMGAAGRAGASGAL